MNTTRRFVSQTFSVQHRDGFTLMELLVVMATLAVLAVVLLPALAGTKPNTQAFQCMNNQRQIILAWQMYAADNSGLLPPNDWYSCNGGLSGSYRGLPFDFSWVGGEMDQVTGNTQATNTALLSNPKYAALAKYATNVAIYHCPSDQSVVQPYGQRVRSVSMNSAIGSVWNHPNPAAGKMLGGPLPAGFLDGNGWNGNSLSHYWQTCNKLGNIKNPSDIFVIADESPFSINDALFYMSMGPPDANGNPTSTQIIETPASYHNGACTFAFADGHVEIHRWLGSTIKITAAQYNYPAKDSLVDLQWLQSRTTAAK